jgi:hypothetical protein
MLPGLKEGVGPIIGGESFKTFLSQLVKSGGKQWKGHDISNRSADEMEVCTKECVRYVAHDLKCQEDRLKASSDIGASLSKLEIDNFMAASMGMRGGYFVKELLALRDKFHGMPLGGAGPANLDIDAANPELPVFFALYKQKVEDYGLEKVLDAIRSRDRSLLYKCQ